MGLLDAIKGLVDAFHDSKTKTDEAVENTVNAKGLRQVSYFKPRETDNHFVRCYAPIVKITDHELYMFLGGEVRVISSKYFIPQHLEKTSGGDLLLMFVHDKELYPLPWGRGYFDRNFDLQVRYPPGKRDLASLAARHPDSQNATRALNQAREKFVQARDQVRNFAASQGQFFQDLPPLVPAMAEEASQTNQVNQTRVIPEEGALVRILPAEPEEIVAKTKKSRFRKKKEKAGDWDVAVRHLVRPD